MKLVVFLFQSKRLTTPIVYCKCFLSFDGSLQITSENGSVSGKCIIVNKNIRYIFSCEGKVGLSVLIDPNPGFSKELIHKMDGHCMILNRKMEEIQQKAASLVDANDKQPYVTIIQEFAEFLNIQRDLDILDKHIKSLWKSCCKIAIATIIRPIRSFCKKRLSVIRPFSTSAPGADRHSSEKLYSFPLTPKGVHGTVERSQCYRCRHACRI